MKKELAAESKAFGAPDLEDPNRLIRVRLSSGQTVQLPASELRRRTMAISVARKIQDLVENHHVNEKGHRIKLDPQWKQIYADPSPDMRIIAGAQKGKTLYQLIKALAQALLGLTVGWVMPKQDKINQFVNEKLNPTIKNTPLYRELQSISDGNDTMKFKTFGDFGKLIIVTSNSQSELTAFSADCMHVDERDFCNRQILPMYPSRMNWSPFKLTNEISTPTIEGSQVRVGQRGDDNIHSEFLNGDQHRWFNQCPHCGEWQILDWFENVIKAEHDEAGQITNFTVRDTEWRQGSPVDIRVCCVKCEQPFNRGGKGQWVCMNPGARVRSYWVESLASMVGPTLAELLEMFQKALGNPAMMMQFMNMMLGRPFAGGHMRFTETLFERSEGKHEMLQRSDGPCTIGIDVNRPWLDIQISLWRNKKQYKVWAGKLQGGVDEVIDLVKRFNVTGGVIDTHPETKFACTLQEQVYEKTKCRIVRCKYATTDTSDPVIVSLEGDLKRDPPRLITVNRTYAIDMLYGSMQTHVVQWFRSWRNACDGAMFEEFNKPVRRLVVNEAGNERYIWEGKPDHALHAAVYDMLAGEILGMAVERDLSDIGPFVHEMMHGGSMPGQLPSAPQPSSRDDVVIFMG